MLGTFETSSKLPVALAGLALFFALPAAAIVTGVDSTGNIIGSPSLFDGVATLVTNGSGCSGSLLSDGSHILTAAHCVSGALPSQITVTFGTSGGPLNYSVSAFAIAPGYAIVPATGISRSADIAVLTLTTIADPLLHRYGIYTQTDEFTKPFTMLGYGHPGAGATGSTSGFGSLRSGTNTFDVDPFFVVGNSVVDFGVYMMYDFDNGNDAQNVVGTNTTQPTEGLIAPGDSGGPSFLLVSGNLMIAGVHSWVGRLEDSNGVSNDIDGVVNSSFGEVAGDTRVSTYASFINAAEVPEPSTSLMAGLGLALAAWIARRSRCQPKL